MAKIPTFNPKLDNLEFNVEIKIAWRFKARMWLGLRLIGWGAYILGARVNVNHTPKDKPRGYCDGCSAADSANRAIELLRRTNDAMEGINSRYATGGPIPTGKSYVVGQETILPVSCLVPRKARGPVKLACGCLDICTDQRPGHPSSRGAPSVAPKDPPNPAGYCKCGALLWFESERKARSCARCTANVQAQLDTDMLYYGESFHIERDGQKTRVPPDRVNIVVSSDDARSAPERRYHVLREDTKPEDKP